MKPCDICIEEECKGTRNCDCSSCDKKDICPKKIKPTVRMTTRCTQSCSHCCYECSPSKSDFMTIEMAEKIKTFLNDHDAVYINLMGGEFYKNRYWKEIFKILIPGLPHCRLVTNGDWAGVYPYKYIEEFKKYPNLKVSISEDQWHTNKHVRRAREELDYADIMWSMPTPEQASEDSIVPIGRSLYQYCMYSSFFAYCTEPQRKYDFLIDEKGDIFKCPFGIWKLCNIEDPEFKNKFKTFNKKFESVFITNCKSCINIHEFSIRKNKRYI